jgi:L,D-transpeptidase catalytic domain
MKERVLIGVAAVLAVATVGVAVAIGVLDVGGDGGDGSSAATVARKTVAPHDNPPVPAAGDQVPPRRSVPVPSLAQRPSRGRYFAILRVRGGARLPLYASPGGRLVRTMSARSDFGSPRVLAVARERGSWLGVSTSLRPDGRLGWVRFDEARLRMYWTRYSLRVGLASRTLQLRYGDRLIGTYTVTVGAAGSDTPRGRFAITDALAFDQSPYYGCCALALSGHQNHLPVGWLGGDRIAIHGTPGPVGYAASHGCIRATDDTMRVLFRRVPLGTPVFVRD